MGMEAEKTQGGEMIELLIIFILAIIFELTDSAIGMLYGTLLAPILIIAGYNPFLVVPAILLSQACGGFLATYSHHSVKNAEWGFKSRDFKIASILILFGIVSVFIGAFVGSIITPIILKTYIGILCIAMGSLVILKKKFKFSWKKISIIAILSAFNKSLSGGAYGPVVATGNIASGIEEKRAIGITDFAEAPICVMAFVAWVVLSGFPDTRLILPLCVGAGIGGLIGPYLLSKVKSTNIIKLTVGLLAFVSGVIVLIKTWW